MKYLTAYGAVVFTGRCAVDFVSIPAASSSVGLAADPDRQRRGRDGDRGDADVGEEETS